MHPNKNKQSIDIAQVEAYMFERLSKEALERYMLAKSVQPETAGLALIRAMSDCVNNKYTRITDAVMKQYLQEHLHKQNNQRR